MKIKFGFFSGVGVSDGLVDGVLDGVSLGLLEGFILADGEKVGVMVGQKPHDSGQLAPTSKPAFGAVSSPRKQYILMRSAELFNLNHVQSCRLPISIVKSKLGTSAQVAAQEPQVSWQANLTLP